MNGYTLGILWNMGTLTKGTNKFCIQTSDESKLYYMDYLIKNVCPDKEIKERERTVRGEIKKVYILNFSSKELAENLRMLGYDKPDRDIPEYANEGFMCATFEILSNKQKHDSWNDVWILSSESKCNSINNMMSKKCGLKKNVLNASNGNSKILCYTSTEYIKIIDLYSKVSDRNIEWWKGMSDWCENKKEST